MKHRIEHHTSKSKTGIPRLPAVIAIVCDYPRRVHNESISGVRLCYPVGPSRSWFAERRAWKGRMDDLAHVPLPDYINLTDIKPRRNGWNEQVIPAGQRGCVEANDVKYEGLLNVTLASWV